MQKCSIAPRRTAYGQNIFTWNAVIRVGGWIRKSPNMYWRNISRDGPWDRFNLIALATLAKMFYRSSGTAYGQETFAWNAVIRKWVWCTCKACSPPHSLPAIVSIRASWQKLLAILEIEEWKYWAYAQWSGFKVGTIKRRIKSFWLKFIRF